MTTYNTPNLVDQLRAEIEELKSRVETLENNKKPNIITEQHAMELDAVMNVFDQVPAGWKISIPTIAENLEIDLPRDTITTRVYTLVKANKLKRHQIGNQHPTFSRP